MSALSSIRSRRFSRWITFLVLFGAGFIPAVSSKNAQNVRGAVSCGEIGFTLPETGWVKVDEVVGSVFRVSCTRNLSTGRQILFSAWPVDPAVQCRFWLPETHEKAYFAMERNQVRPSDTKWEKFVESERTIAGRRFPVLTFEFSTPADKRQWDGIMLLCFPTDFPQRQRFYVLMWMDTQPRTKPDEWPAELDALVQSFTIGHHLSPSILLGLSEETARSEPVESKLSARALAKRVVKATGQKTSYRSEYVFIDRLISELQPHGQISLHWALDYMAPDTYHVLQRGWDPKGRVYLFDEWLNLKTGHYVNAGFWMRIDGEAFADVRSQLSRSLRVTDLLELMTASPPATLTAHRYLGARYYALTYQLDSTSRLVNFPVTYASLVEGPYRVKIWVDAATGLLAKSEVFGTTMKADGQPVSATIAQTFGRWGEDFRIESGLPGR